MNYCLLFNHKYKSLNENDQVYTWTENYRFNSKKINLSLFTWKFEMLEFTNVGSLETVGKSSKFLFDIYGWKKIQSPRTTK